MPADPSASAPRLHRDLRRLKATIEAAGHSAYATVAGGLIIEDTSPDPDPGLYRSLLIEGSPRAGWSIRTLAGRYVATHETIEEVRSALDLAFGLDPVEERDPCPSTAELRRHSLATSAHIFGSDGRPGCPICWAVLQTF